jgi:hypothetical protein
MTMADEPNNPINLDPRSGPDAPAQIDAELDKLAARYRNLPTLPRASVIARAVDLIAGFDEEKAKAQAMLFIYATGYDARKLDELIAAARAKAKKND